MSAQSSGALQIAVLLGGAIVLLGLGFAGGRVTAGGSRPAVESEGRAEPGIAGSGENAEASHAEGAREASAGKETTSGPRQRSSSERIYDEQVYKKGYDLSDQAGDKVSERAIESSEPGMDALSEHLPGPLAKFAPGLAKTATFYGGSLVKNGVADAANDHVQEGAERLKGGGEGEEHEGGGERAAAEAAGGREPVSAASREGNPAIQTASAHAGAQGGAWSVELGRFATAANANAFSSDIGRRGVDTRVALEQDNVNRTWYAVRTATYGDQTGARTALDHLNDMGFEGTVVSDGGGR